MARGGRTGKAALPGVPVPTAAQGSSPTPRPVYGAGAALQADARALPSGSGAPPAGATGAPAPYTGPLPGSLTSLTAPSQRPGEPVTAGLPTGPGPGAEALTLTPPVAQWQTARDTIGAAARNPGASPALQLLARRLQIGY